MLLGGTSLFDVACDLVRGGREHSEIHVSSLHRFSKLERNGFLTDAFHRSATCVADKRGKQQEVSPSTDRTCRPHFYYSRSSMRIDRRHCSHG